jgi:hypothetical protein
MVCGRTPHRGVLSQTKKNSQMIWDCYSNGDFAEIKHLYVLNPQNIYRIIFKNRVFGSPKKERM